ncbi:hypothetical protein EO95_13925 [Methanosarcina sp. 1.H.T.1A.1]|uniref:DUF2206 domain-containing protein n=1 Tax=Methanosarcina sp. 1.H.T.1A.1 TaxID=1483602 RepID=UPI0006223A3E|nr:DUF2206 domain-containing protein [Methanosarcina sp. 1.H.T.1A.1]KKI00369.1 hypothetical protein EO95_13925 [Methanosarcina sp. 1.H.T.1A.1]
MKIKDPFQINDWCIKNFLIIIFSVQLSVFGLIMFDSVISVSITYQISIIRQIICFIDLAFVPGILILRILKLHKLGITKTLFFSIGLSLFSLMSIGLFINVTYPLFGIYTPLSLKYLMFTIFVFILILCLICYLRDKEFSEPNYIDLKEIFSSQFLSLFIIPFLCIFGTYCVNFYHYNGILMAMFVLISVLVFLIGFDVFVPNKLYPLAVWIISISLIFHDTLISMYVNKYDAISELYFSSLVINNLYWNSTLPSNYNSMLSVTLIAPIFKILCGFNLTWVYKIVYPFLYSFIPLGLYSLYNKLTNEKIAFLASFYFMSLYPFYKVIPSLCKQSTAEIFFALLLLLMFDFKKDATSKFLLIVLSFSLIVSHYGTSYLILFSLLFVFVSLSIYGRIVSYLSQNKSNTYFLIMKNNELNGINKYISLNYLIIFCTMVFAWYLYISNSSIFNSIFNLGTNIFETIYINFMSPEYSRGMNYFASSPDSLLRLIYKMLHYVTMFFICVGLLAVSIKECIAKFENIYSCFSLYWLLICVAGIVISGFAVMNPYRLYHLSLFFLSPIGVIGGIICIKLLSCRILKNTCFSQVTKFELRTLYVFFIIFLLFNSGFIFEVFKDNPSSISLSQESVKQYGDLEHKGYFIDYMYEDNVFNAKWLSLNMVQKSNVYATKGNGEGGSALIAYGLISPAKIYPLNSDTTQINKGNYVYLSYLNIVEGVCIGYDPKLSAPTYYDIKEMDPFLDKLNSIYSNGGSKILYS